MFKYSCRKCPIRNRCIDESASSPGAKIMVRKAFEARTDTLATWNLLQKSCLLLQAEEMRSPSALSDRLQEIRQAKELPQGIVGVNILVAVSNYEDLARTTVKEKAE